MGSSWETVVDKCCRGHSQPLLLLYASTALNPISTANALEKAIVLNRDQNCYRANHGPSRPSSVMQRPESARHRGPAPDYLISVARGGSEGNQYRNNANVQTDCVDRVRQPSYLFAVDSRDIRGNSEGRSNNQRDTPGGVNSSSSFEHAREYKPNVYDNDRYVDATLPRTLRRNPLQQELPSYSSKDCSGQVIPMSYNNQYDRQSYDSYKGNERYNSMDIVSCSTSPWINDSDGYDESRNYIDSKTVEKILQSRTRKGTVTRSSDSVSSGSSCSLNSGDSRSSISSNVDARPTALGCCTLRNDNNSSSGRPQLPSGKPQFPIGVINKSGIQTVGDRSSSSSTCSGLSTGSSSLESNHDSGYRSGDQDGTASTCSSLSLESSTSFIGGEVNRLIVQMPGIGRVPIRVGDKPNYWEASRGEGVVPDSGNERFNTLPLRNANPGSSADAQCQQSLLAADELMEKSRSNASNNFSDKALELCLKAVALFQSAQSIPNVSNDMLMHLRRKHSASVLYSRRLLIEASSKDQKNVQLCTKRENASTMQQPAQMRSKEETGEILANRFSQTKPNNLHQSNETLNTASTSFGVANTYNDLGHRHNTKMSYEDMLKKQVKLFTMKDLDNGNDISSTGEMSVVYEQTPRASNQQKREIRSISGEQIAQLPTRSFINSFNADTNLLESPSNTLTRSSDSMNSLNCQPSIYNTPHITDERCVGPPKQLCPIKIMEKSKPVVAAKKPIVPPKKHVVVAPKKKTVRFSDNVSLVACNDDVPPPIDYVAYAVSYLQRQNEGQIIKCPADASSTPDLDNLSISSRISSTFKSDPKDAIVSCSSSVLSESDSDFCENSSDVSDGDSEGTMIEGSTGKVRCSLCHKKWVDLSVVYCNDCNFYMSKFEQVSM